MLKTLALAAAAHQAIATADPIWKQFIEFKARYSITFESLEEETKRFGIFKENIKRAKELNDRSAASNGVDAARFGITKFAHLDPKEFKKMYLGSNPNAPGVKELLKKAKKYVRKNVKGAADWRDTPAMSAVKDQGQCGSCWAFSATEAVESGYWKTTGNDAPTLAPQQTVSCSTEDYGCQGGWTLKAYEYMEQAGGLEPESDYPYFSGDSGDSGQCKADRSEFSVQVGEPTVVAQSPEQEDDMLDAITQEPISVCVDAESWQWYMGGIVGSDTCGQSVDHCVQVAGYQDGDNNAWIVRNSWNTNWGEEGYIRVRAKENACNISSCATTVTASDEDFRKHKAQKSELYM